MTKLIVCAVAAVLVVLTVIVGWLDRRMQQRGRDEFEAIVAGDRELQELERRARDVVWPDWAPGDRRA